MKLVPFYQESFPLPLAEGLPVVTDQSPCISKSTLASILAFSSQIHLFSYPLPLAMLSSLTIPFLAILSSLTDGPGHVHSVSLSLCFGLFHVPLDKLSLLCTIKSFLIMEQSCPQFLYCTPFHIATKFEATLVSLKKKKKKNSAAGWRDGSLVRALTSLWEDPCLSLSTHCTAHKGIQHSVLASIGVGTHMGQRQTYKQNTHTPKIKKEKVTCNVWN